MHRGEGQRAGAKGRSGADVASFRLKVTAQKLIVPIYCVRNINS